MSLTFHRTFSFSRSSIHKVIRLAASTPGFRQEDLANKTDLGTIYQEAMPRYAFRSGLIDKKNYLTPFGNFAFKNDRALERTETQWLLHYYLAAPHGPTTFWSYLVKKCFLIGNRFTSEDLTQNLINYLKTESEKIPAARSVSSTVAAFTGTYLKADGLQRLNLLQESAPNAYQIPSIDTPPVWALGYALIDYWHVRYGTQITINLDDLAQGDFAAIFLLGEERLTNLLLELKQEGMIDLYRLSRPYQVVLLQPNPEYALENMYME